MKNICRADYSYPSWLEWIPGYIMLGDLISIFANELARRSQGKVGLIYQGN